MGLASTGRRPYADPNPVEQSSEKRFRSSRWSLVLKAKSADDPAGRDALNQLCGVYWGPLYAYLRRKGHDPEDAQDAVQAFFTYFLEGGFLARVEKGRGRFRGYLLAVLEHWLANERRRARASKRGGGASPLSLDFAHAERESSVDLADSATPLEAYRRAWAVAVLRQAVRAFRLEFEERRPREHFQAVLRHLTSGGDPETYATTADRLGCSAADLANLLQASRRRLREILRETLEHTAEGASDAEEELRELFQILY